MVFRIRASMRMIVSFCLAIFQLYFAVLYIFPSFTSSPAPTVKVIQFIQSLGPFFTVGFGISGGLLLATLLWRRFIHVGHMCCLAVFMSYGVALWFGAFGQHPHGTLIGPSLCFVPIIGHAALALSYGGDRE